MPERATTHRATTHRATTDQATTDQATTATVEVIEGRTTRVGGLPVRRVLPTRGRRTIGAWCFVDHMGPTPAGPDTSVAPHPHIGLQTVTWLFEGAVLHRDSLGSEQLIRPGQLNLMTAGHGVVHAEEDPGGPSTELHGLQLWVAQPAATRDGDAAFEHHAELPRVDVDGATATVLVGCFADASSPARRDTDHVGVELALRPGTSSLPLDPAYEYGLVAVDGPVVVDGSLLPTGAVAYLPVGADELGLAVDRPTRALLIGGVPFAEEVRMWWNFVARSHEELTAAWRDWSAAADRFPPVASGLPRIEVGAPPWSRDADAPGRTTP